ncbi:NAD(P)H nitroreductase [Mycobacterium sp. EPa45]|uniref:Acg family FMN-binding oxidoreductase n=1 Tax=Mycobacterium sp. EPa45 TaxID=1545728 RepID=UPI000642270A|nr:NAD(P)H nitroreductase [Mycobacterium sp. EPa45]AKK30460.1 NAD(P)H nitroreductase [Mycobacterium sp. EPa45]
MTTNFPDDATLRAGLELAGRAPSIHNTQPWQWRVGPHSLNLYSRLELRLPHTDPDGRDLIVSCGAALHHATVALAALGWRTTVHRTPNPDDPEHLASLQVHRGPPADTDIAMAAAIPRRRTDRRMYSSWPVAMGDIALMGGRVARLGVTMRRVELTDDFVELLRQAMRKHGDDTGYLDELMVWSGRYAAAEGVPAHSVPRQDGAVVPGRVFFGSALDQPHGVSAAEDNGVLLALGTAADDIGCQLRAGEAASVITLTATVQGLASCAVSEVLEIADTREAVRAEVFGGERFPQMLLRVGWAPVNADPLPATPRRPLSDVLCRLDGSAFLG